MNRYDDCKYFNIIYNAVQKTYPFLEDKISHILLIESIFAYDNYVINLEQKTYIPQEVLQCVGKTLLHECYKDSPKDIYETIIQEASSIIKNMNDGYISSSDYKERCDFITQIERTEFTLFSALSLLKTSNNLSSPDYDEITLNIRRLRGINDLIKNFTRNSENVKTDKTEYEAAKAVYKLLKSLQSLGYDYSLSMQERTNLNIDHKNDLDLNINYSYKKWLTKIMLFQLRMEILNCNTD